MLGYFLGDWVYVLVLFGKSGERVSFLGLVLLFSYFFFFKQSICDAFDSTKLAFKLLISSFQLSRKIVYGISWSNPHKVTSLSFSIGSV